MYCIGYINGFESVDNMMKTDSKKKSPNVQINTREDVALIIYSSGTIGLPKGVVLSHYELVAGSDNLAVNISCSSFIYFFYFYTILEGIIKRKQPPINIMRQYRPRPPSLP